MTGGPTNQRVATYTIDASAIVKIFSLEEGSKAARRIFQKSESGKIRLIAPDLLLYEIGNALGKGKKLPSKDVIAGVALLQNSKIIFFKLTSVVLGYSATFMEKYDLTFYDAVYGALAFVESVPLISANPKDHKKISEIVVKKLV